MVVSAWGLWVFSFVFCVTVLPEPQQLILHMESSVWGQLCWINSPPTWGPKSRRNWEVEGFWENTCFVSSNGRKTTFEWPKVVSEVSFPRFWGVFWGGLFSGIFRFGDRKCHFRDIAIHALFTKPRKTHLGNHFWPLESGFSAIATYKTRVFLKNHPFQTKKFHHCFLSDPCGPT